MKVPVASRWYTAAEIAQLGFPSVPDNARRVHDLAVANGWAQRTAKDGTPLARQRRARGGGTEYHSSLLPEETQLLLRARSLAAEAEPLVANDTGKAEADAWGWFDQQTSIVKATAMRRMAILMEVEAGISDGTTKTAAIEAVARNHNISPRAVAGWFALIAGIPRSQRLPRLAPQYKGGGKAVEVDAHAWQILKSDYLRAEKPAFAACYNRLLEDYARPNGIALPCCKTLRRRMDCEISAALKKSKRDGREAVRRTVPPQRRTVMNLHAMQAVNVDGHTFDVFVQWDDGRIERPVMVGIQDLYSRKLLAHRIGETENTVLTRMAFADLFRDHGIPSEAVLDNGRAFASKALTGGAKTRFRFKIKDSEPTGVLTALGVLTHWTLPYRGSSKPIERAWRDLCEDIAKHPTVAGAYTGNKPDAKPENYRDRAIPIAEFRAHVARRIATHNARTGRATEAAKGGSFDAAFAASYAASKIGKATAMQLSLALLQAEDRRCDRENGSVTLAGNRYWSPELSELAGKKVTVRCDPDNLHSEIHVYLESGEYFGVAPVIEKTGFFDKSGAERRSKLEKAVRRKVREAEEAANLLHIDRVAEIMSGPSEPAPKLQAGAVRIVRHQGQTAAALKPSEQAVHTPAEPSFIDDFVAGAARLRSVE